MKELKMFPQITEETEENLLNLEDEDPPQKSSPYSSTPPSNPSSSSSSESPPETPTSPNHETQVPCPLPVITTEDADRTPCSNHQKSPPPEEDYNTPPPRTRMRSLSGGAYRLAPALTSSVRHRRQSGDDVLTRVSPSRRATLFDQFRPRSKSDSKGKRPTFLTTLKNSILGGGAQRKASLDSNPPPLDQLYPHDDIRHQRPRSGSETKGTMSKMIDLFRSRSHSVSYDSRGKMVPPFIPSDDTIKRKKRAFFQTQRALDCHKRDSYICHADDETGESRFDFRSPDIDKIIPAFLGFRTCYDMMPTSGKVCVADTELLVKNAFGCLVTNDIRSVPLWDSAAQAFVGVLTISDFINVLRHYYYSSREDIKSIEDQTISTWRKITNMRKPLVSVGPEDSLMMASKLLLKEKIHRLPLYHKDKCTVNYVITKRGLLKYLYKNFLERMIQGHVRAPSYLKRTVGDLMSEIGTWENIATVSVNTRVIDALDLFCERNVSAMPVMDEDNKLVDIFAKFDVFALAKEQTYDNLDMTIAEALDKAEVHEHLFGCSLDDSLGTVIDKFIAVKVHRLVVVDGKMDFKGMLSLSDIMRFLINDHLVEESSVSDTIDETPEGATGGTEDTSVFLEPGSQASGSSLQQSSGFENQSSDLTEEFSRLQVEEENPEPL